MIKRTVGAMLRFLFPVTRKKRMVFILIAAIVLVTLVWDYYRFLRRTMDVDSNAVERTSADAVDSNNVNNNIDLRYLSNYTEPPKLPSALVFTDSDRVNNGKTSKLKSIFFALKINYDFITWNRLNDNFLVFPRLRDMDGFPRYHAIVFTSQRIFKDLDPFSRDILYNYCKTFNLGMIILTDSMHLKGATKFHTFSTLPMSMKTGVMCLRDLEVAESSLLKITASGNTLRREVHGKRHAIFMSDHPSFEPVLYAKKLINKQQCHYVDNSDDDDDSQNASDKYIKSTSIMYDKGEYDGVRKVFFGTPINNSFLHKLIFMDSLSTLSNGILGYDLNRYIQIDIDDIFVGATGKKLVRSDVEALVRSQQYLSARIPGFKYYLGYAGAKYRNSNLSSERDGDKALVQYGKYFKWFCHTYRHTKAHTHTKEELVAEFEKNKQFAKEHDIEVDSTYSVAPHHAGVYPTHDALYEAWKEVWGINVTSTEGYPHLYPAHGRKGFLYKDIHVLPRQTCGLFTGTLHNADYPKGPHWLERSAYGGELFWSIMDNPITIFMTHQGNFGFDDRLAIHLFKNVTNFIQKWTHIRLRSIPPVAMAKKYFEMFPKQLDPVWEDPCMDLRHQKIWADTEKYCKVANKSRIQRLPDVVILGPQKTGSTALLSFLTLHPQMRQSRISKHAYEEIQFFNRKDYMQGLLWYMSFYPEEKASNVFNLEKSANYFDSMKAPLRAHSLIPNAKLIVISSEPKRRAYSWYQHMRFKGESVALNHTFYEVLTNQNKTDNDRFSLLHLKCLHPGLYAECLERWLQYYKSSQILIVDGWELRKKPVVVMQKITKFLKLDSFPYGERIRFDNNKGFYCATDENGSHKCLGSSKGRKYNEMSNEENQFLTDFYRLPNLQFVDLLSKNHMPLPNWLVHEIKKEPD